MAGQRYWSTILNQESIITTGTWTPDDQQVFPYFLICLFWIKLASNPTGLSGHVEWINRRVGCAQWDRDSPNSNVGAVEFPVARLGIE